MEPSLNPRRILASWSPSATDCSEGVDQIQHAFPPLAPACRLCSLFGAKWADAYTDQEQEHSSSSTSGNEWHGAAKGVARRPRHTNAQKRSSRYSHIARALALA